MKRTIKEIYDLIKQKIENAENHHKRLSDDLFKERAKIDKDETQIMNDIKMINLVEGEIRAYTDIKILIETSEVLENERFIHR